MKLAHSIGNIVNPVAGPPLDDITGNAPSAAWGLRKLSSSYTGAACYVYDSAGATSNVYFDSNNEVSLNSETISGLSLQEFSTVNGNGDVTVGYQVTSPKASLRFIDDYFKVAGYRFPNPNDSCTILAVAASKGGTYGVITDIEGYDDGVELIYASSEWSWRIKTSDIEGTLMQKATKAQLAIAMYDTSLGANQQTIRINGDVTGQDCTEDKHVGSTDRFRIGSRKDADNQLNGWIAEGMVWESALSYNDMVSLEENIFMYYKIPRGSA